MSNDQGGPMTIRFVTYHNKNGSNNNTGNNGGSQFKYKQKSSAFQQQQREDSNASTSHDSINALLQEQALKSHHHQHQHNHDHNHEQFASTSTNTTSTVTTNNNNSNGNNNSNNGSTNYNQYQSHLLLSDWVSTADNQIKYIEELETEFDKLMSQKQQLDAQLIRLPYKATNTSMQSLRVGIENQLNIVEKRISSIKLELRKLNIIKTH